MWFQTATIRYHLKAKQISECWAQLGEDRSISSSKAKLLLLLFGENDFFEVHGYQNQSIEYDMRLQLTSVTPDVDKLSRKMQIHCSH